MKTAEQSDDLAFEVSMYLKSLGLNHKPQFSNTTQSVYFEFSIYNENDDTEKEVELRLSNHPVNGQRQATETINLSFDWDTAELDDIKQAINNLL